MMTDPIYGTGTTQVVDPMQIEDSVWVLTINPATHPSGYAQAVLTIEEALTLRDQLDGAIHAASDWEAPTAADADPERAA